LGFEIFYKPNKLCAGGREQLPKLSGRKLCWATVFAREIGVFPGEGEVEGGGRKLQNGGPKCSMGGEKKPPP